MKISLFLSVLEVYLVPSHLCYICLASFFFYTHRLLHQGNFHRVENGQIAEIQANIVPNICFLVATHLVW